MTARIYEEENPTIIGIVLFQESENIREFFQRGGDISSAKRRAFFVSENPQTDFRIIGGIKNIDEFACRYSESF